MELARPGQWESEELNILAMREFGLPYPEKCLNDFKISFKSFKSFTEPFTVRDVFLATVDIGFRVTLLFAKFLETTDVLLLLPGQHRQLPLQHVNGLKQFNWNVGKYW